MDRISSYRQKTNETRTLTAENWAEIDRQVQTAARAWLWLGPLALGLLFWVLHAAFPASARAENLQLLGSGPEGQESFSDSQFGHAPARPRLSHRDHLTSKFVEDLDEAEQDRRTQGGRTPASIVAAEPVPESARNRKGVQEIALIASDLGYFPRTVFVTQDIPVRLYVTGSSKQSLCVLMDSFGIRKQIRSQKIEEIQFTPATAGRFRFYCPVNGAEGTLVVKEGPLSTAMTPGQGG